MDYRQKYQSNLNTFQDWMCEQIALLDERETKEDNNSYEAPQQMMLLQGKRRVLERISTETRTYNANFSLAPTGVKNPLTQCLLLTQGMLRIATFELNEHRERKKIHQSHTTMKHARTLGEYSMLCDIERELLSLE